MANLLISNRLQFKTKKKQSDFIHSAKNKTGLTWADMSKRLMVNTRTLTDWARGKYNMSDTSAIFLSRMSSIKLPADIKIIKWNQHLKHISKKGGLQNMLKNGKIGGDSAFRKKQWNLWWKREGKLKQNFITRPRKIRFPPKNTRLAEFMGIMMGDGGVAPYHISITLDSKTDKKYGKYVLLLIKNLFNVEAKVYLVKDCRAFNIVVQRKNLSALCVTLGLPLGNKIKQGLDIPYWILKNKNLKKACLRGLIDTDGSIFRHSYLSKGKMYDYLKIAFTSKSYNLVKSVYGILKNFGFNARISRSLLDVRIESQKDVLKYIKLIGTHNPKNQDKFTTWKVALNGKAAVC